MSKLDSLLRTNKTTNGSTHTRIADPSTQIYGGAYNFGSNESAFYDAVYQEVVIEGKPEFLTEKQRPNGTFVVDLDFRYKPEITTRQYTADDIDTIICNFLEEIKEVFIIDASFTIYVMEKPTVNCLSDKTKDGVHLLFTFDADNEAKLEVRKRVIKKQLDCLDGITNSLDDVYDISIFKGTTNWMVYGCRKPNHDVYRVVKAYDCILDPLDNEWITLPIAIPNPITPEIFNKLSVRTSCHTFVAKDCHPQSLRDCFANSVTKNKNINSVNIDKWKDLVFNVIINGPKISYDEWLKIGAVLKTNGFTLGEFINFTNDPINIDKTIAHWERFQDKGISIEYLCKLAKLTNKSEYEQWKLKWSKLDSIIICNTEDEASNFFFDKLKNNLISYKGRLFYKKEYSWLCDTESIKDAILCEIMNTNICKNAGSKKGEKPYSKNYNDAIKIRNSLLAKIRIHNDDPNLYYKFHSTTKGKLCFQDGVLDITNNTFRLWKDIPHDEIYTTIIISRNFAEYWNKPDYNVIDEIKAKIFEPLYGEKMNDALHFLSRALAGFSCDKRWGTYLGNRNCGKGVEYMLLYAAFGNYVSTFELGNILYTRKTVGLDTLNSKSMYWLMDLEFVRLAVSQEIPDINSGLIGNGKLLKKISGGEDTIVARRNYDRFDTHFIIDSTFYIKGNFSFLCDSADCYETCCQFSSVTQFKSQSEIDAIKSDNTRDISEIKRYRVSDANIKTKCLCDDWINACIMLIVQNYKNYAVPIAIEDNDEIEQNEIIAAIKEKYEITLNENDMILVDDIKTRLPGLDRKKVCAELQALNIHKIKCLKSGQFRQKWIYYGIKIKNN